MDREQFVQTVTSRSSLGHDQAEAVSRATLDALGDALSIEQAHQLAGELPDGLRDALTGAADRRGDPDARRVGLDELRERVAAASEVSPAAIDDALGAVLVATRAAAPAEFDAMMEQLPDELRRLTGDTPPVDGR